MNLTTVHFKILNFNSRGSPVNGDKKITFESDEKGSLLSDMCGYDNYRVTLLCQVIRKRKGMRVGFPQRRIHKPLKRLNWSALRNVTSF